MSSPAVPTAACGPPPASHSATPSVRRQHATQPAARGARPAPFRTLARRLRKRGSFHLQYLTVIISTKPSHSQLNSTKGMRNGFGAKSRPSNGWQLHARKACEKARSDTIQTRFESGCSCLSGTNMVMVKALCEYGEVPTFKVQRACDAWFGFSIDSRYDLGTPMFFLHRRVHVRVAAVSAFGLYSDS
eukprot:scaffold58485_cov38-Tisochrysis_lutea.AAC.2